MGEQGSRELVRLTDEHEGVRHVVITHMYDRRADPGAYTPLCTVEDGVHHVGGLGCSLDTVKALASVAQAVVDVLREQI